MKEASDRAKSQNLASSRKSCKSKKLLEFPVDYYDFCPEILRTLIQELDTSIFTTETHHFFTFLLFKLPKTP